MKEQRPLKVNKAIKQKLKSEIKDFMQKYGITEINFGSHSLKAKKDGKNKAG